MRTEGSEPPGVKLLEKNTAGHYNTWSMASALPGLEIQFAVEPPMLKIYALMILWSILEKTIYQMAYISIQNLHTTRS